MEIILTLLQTTAADPTAQANGFTSILFTVVPLALMLVVFYFLLIRPEKKRAKKDKEMRENLQVAEVVTIGGIIGRVLSIQEETIVVETGSDRNRIRVLKTAIAENRTTHDDVEKVVLKK